VRSLEKHVPYLSASEVMIHEEALYQVYVPLPLPLQLLFDFDSTANAILRLFVSLSKVIKVTAT